MKKALLIGVAALVVTVGTGFGLASASSQDVKGESTTADAAFEVMETSDQTLSTDVLTLSTTAGIEEVPAVEGENPAELMPADAAFEVMETSDSELSTDVLTLSTTAGIEEVPAVEGENPAELTPAKK